MKLDVTRAGPVVPVPVDPEGLRGPTPGRARGPKWRRTSPGLFVPVDVRPEGTEQRIVEAAASAPDGAAVTGWAALHWQGAEWFEGRTAQGRALPVPIALGDERVAVSRPDVLRCHQWLFEDDVIAVDGLPVTRPERAVCGSVLRARYFEVAVRTIDMALASDLVDLEELSAYAERLRGRPYSRLLHSALVVAEENVWSPTETAMRLRWLAHRPATLMCNAPIFDDRGNHLFTPDLFDPEVGVAGEYDGMVHEEARVRRRDLEREELARQHGIESVSMVSLDLRDVAAFERRLDSAYRRAERRVPTGTWTLEQPPGWADTSTVARRRALSVSR